MWWKNQHIDISGVKLEKLDAETVKLQKYTSYQPTMMLPEMLKHVEVLGLQLILIIVE